VLAVDEEGDGYTGAGAAWFDHHLRMVRQRRHGDCVRGLAFLLCAREPSPAWGGDSVAWFDRHLYTVCRKRV
jgi:hypothetical protein